jgi:hypothetical protein
MARFPQQRGYRQRPAARDALVPSARTAAAPLSAGIALGGALRGVVFTFALD